MKATQTTFSTSGRIPIEIFDPKLLKETQLLAMNDFYSEEEEEWIEDETDIKELSFEEFEQTLN